MSRSDYKTIKLFYEITDEIYFHGGLLKTALFNMYRVADLCIHIYMFIAQEQLHMTSNSFLDELICIILFQ